MKITKNYLRNAVATATAGMLAVCMFPASALAAFAPDTKALSADGYVTGASPRPGAPGLDMLGITNVEADPTGLKCALGEQTWASPKFYIWGSTYYNTNANPYLTNAVINYNAGSTIAAPSAVAGGNTAVRTETQPGGNPDAGICLYGVHDEANALWDLKPDVINGTNADTCIYTGDEYKAAFPAGFENYNPVGVRYNYNSISDIIGSMYRLAAAADTVVAQSNGTKRLRYDESATTIAQNYEEYIHGLQGFILQQLEANKAAKKTVAIVMSYDEASQTYTLMNDQSGSATALRYLEVVQNVATNLGDTYPTATQDQLAKADLIILNTTVSDSNSMLGTFTSSMQAKTYYTVNGNQQIGCTYSVARNSVDNAQDMGRILGCLYPEYITQDDLICYYYDEFYHIRSEVLGELLDNAMDGVVNWDATGSDRTNWTAADTDGYSKASVQAKLDLGTAWIAKNAATVSSTMALETKADGSTYVSISASDYTALSKAVKSTQTIKVTPTTKTLKNNKKRTYTLKVTGNVGALSYSVTSAAKKAGVSVSAKGKVTVKKGTKAGTYKITVKAAATSLAKAATKTVKVKVTK